MCTGVYIESLDLLLTKSTGTLHLTTVWKLEVQDLVGFFSDTWNTILDIANIKKKKKAWFKDVARDNWWKINELSNEVSGFTNWSWKTLKEKVNYNINSNWSSWGLTMGIHQLSGSFKVTGICKKKNLLTWNFLLGTFYF